MRLHGQRWVFRVGNSVVKADNAFSWTMWGQERLLVNDEPAHLTGGFLRVFQRFREPWLTAIGEDVLDVRMRAKGRGIACDAVLNGETLVPVETLVANWSGDRHGWPAEDTWRPAGPHGWLVGALPCAR